MNIAKFYIFLGLMYFKKTRYKIPPLVFFLVCTYLVFGDTYSVNLKESPLKYKDFHVILLDPVKNALMFEGRNI